MQLTRRNRAWDPFREMEELSNRMQRLFGLNKLEGNGEHESLSMSDWSPSCDITETEKTYCVQAELPGVKKDDVHVTLQDGVLTIQGERREEREQKDAKFHRREQSYGRFQRSFTMPEDADDAKVDAAFKDGVLSVSIAKSKAKAGKAKQIAVQ